MAKSLPPQGLIQRLIEDLEKVPDHQRMQIIVTHCYLELLVHQLALATCKNKKIIEDSRRDFSQSVKVTLLHEASIISDEHALFLHWFRQRRNDAAHNVDFSIDRNHLKIFSGYTSSDGVTPLDDPSNIGLLCMEIVFGFWNQHVHIFAPIFEKKLFEKET